MTPQVMVEAGELHIGKNHFPLREIASTRTERRDPKMLRRLLGTLAAALGIPVCLYFDAITVEDFSWLVAFPMTLAAVLGFSMLTAHSKYVLLVRTARQEQIAFQSDRAHEVEAAAAQVERCVMAAASAENQPS